MSELNNLKYKYNTLNIFGKIIVLNIAVFLLGFVISQVLKWQILDYFKLPSDAIDALLQPWSIITYSFLHGGLWHLLFNMLMLYYLSQVLLNLLPSKKVLNIFFLGVVVGGLSYILAYSLLPIGRGIEHSLVGASAGVSALLFFVVGYLPDSEIRIFTFNVKWKYIGLVFLILDVLRMLSGDNTGGYISHLGGYLLGFYYAKQLRKGTDIGAGFERMMDSVTSLFSSKSKLKTVHKKSKSSSYGGRSKREFDTLNKQKQIDIILDKISKSGYDSLTEAEKKFLFEAGKD